MGMDEICITDHVDYGIKEDWDSGKEIRYRNGEPMANVDYPAYMKELEWMRTLYGEQITIRTGMEFGMQMHTISRYETLFHRYPFDFIILSVHQVEDLEFWTQDFQRGRTQQEYNERYYKELLDLVQNYKDYSVLGHLDLIVPVRKSTSSYRRNSENGDCGRQRDRGQYLVPPLWPYRYDSVQIDFETVPRTGRRDPYNRKRQP